MSIQWTVDPHTEEILIEQQTIIPPGFISAERCPGGFVLFVILCIHTQTHTELCFFLMQLSPSQFGSHFCFLRGCVWILTLKRDALLEHAVQ